MKRGKKRELVHKRAQSSMEFLSVYGWAILITLVSIGILARFGVLTPELFLPQKCELGTGIVCSDTQLTQDGYVFFRMSNNVGNDISISGAVYNSSNGLVNCELSASQEGLVIPEGKDITLTLENCGDAISSGIRYSGTTELVYTNLNTQFTHRSRGHTILDAEQVSGALIAGGEENGSESGNSSEGDSQSSCVFLEDVREFSSSGYYTGELFDDHVHMPSPIVPPEDYMAQIGFPPGLMPGMDIDVMREDFICLLDNENITQVVGFYVAGNESFEGSDYNDTLALIDSMESDYPGRIKHFLMQIPISSLKLSPQELRTIVENNNNIVGIGEIPFYVPSFLSEDPNDVYWNEVYDVARDNDLIVMLHPYEPEDEANLRAALTANSDVTFLLHGGDEFEDWIMALLGNHSNAYYSLDANQVPEMFQMGDLATFEAFLRSNFDTILANNVAKWKPRIEQYPNRFLWGTDRGYYWHFNITFGQLFEEYHRSFIGALDPSVQERFAHQNAEALFS